MSRTVDKLLIVFATWPSTADDPDGYPRDGTAVKYSTIATDLIQSPNDATFFLAVDPEQSFWENWHIATRQLPEGDSLLGWCWRISGPMARLLIEATDCAHCSQDPNPEPALSHRTIRSLLKKLDAERVIIPTIEPVKQEFVL